jgi:hypothetical protein
MNPAQASGGIVLPLTQAQAQEMQETAAITDSRKWYATLIMKLIKIHKHFLS